MNVEIVLVAPEIPQNTGSVGRLCVATGSTLHLIEPLGFALDDKHVRRAGLDYWEHVVLCRHASWAAFERTRPPGRLLCFSAKAPLCYLDAHYRADDLLVFGRESVGLPAEVRTAYADATYAIPVDSPHVRSLNLATAVAIVLYEARRQLGAAA
jgi:tRNA (cytidine/uridine-2'-O-)-methyltransferase